MLTGGITEYNCHTGAIRSLMISASLSSMLILGYCCHSHGSWIVTDVKPIDSSPTLTTSAIDSPRTGIKNNSVNKHRQLTGGYRIQLHVTHVTQV